MDFVERLVFGSLFIIAVLLIIIGVVLLKKERKRRNCTAIIKGKVVKHSFTSPITPVVKYNVDGIVYMKRFEYTAVIIKSSPRKSVKSNFEDIFDTVLRINKKSFVSYTTLKDLFPIGSEMDVYYCPDKPKLSYVHRYAKSIVADMIIMSGILAFMITLVFFILKFGNQTFSVVSLLSMLVVITLSMVCILLRGIRKK